MYNDSSQQTIIRSIKRLYLLMNKHIEDELKLYGLARSQFQVIYFIDKSGSLSQKELQQVMQVEPATLTVIIDGLEKKGLLKRAENTTDKRSNVLQLTTEGEKLRKKIPLLHEIIEKRMFRDFSENKKKIGTKLIREMIQNLESEKE
jgi:DNA-binding MarR family transcriptional regulator